MMWYHAEDCIRPDMGDMRIGKRICVFETTMNEGVGSRACRSGGGVGTEAIARGADPRPHLIWTTIFPLARPFSR